MLDARGFQLAVGDEVLVIQYSNQIQLADMMWICRTSKPFKTVNVGTIVNLEHNEGTGFPEMGDELICTVQLGKVQIKVRGDSENGWHDHIFQLPRKGE